MSVALQPRPSPAAAIRVLRRAIASRPGNGVLWTNLVVALASAGRVQEARGAAREAAGAGVALDPELIAAIGGAAP